MRPFLGLALVALASLTIGSVLRAQTPVSWGPPEWAYNTTPTPRAPGAKPEPEPDHAQLLTVPGSSQKFTIEQIETGADWFPEDHPTMPEIVAKGRPGPPAVRACAFCHMPNGKGRPSNGSVRGLPVEYFMQQIEDFKNGLRKPADPKKNNVNQMIAFAKTLTPEDTRIAAEYYASMPWTNWIRVVETDRVPKTRVEGFIHYRLEGNETEPMGMRIIEVPEDNYQTEPMRNPRSGFIAYAPPGSIKRGEELVNNGGNGKTIACGICHGADLLGIANIPGIAGRSPTFLARQMYDMQAGTRNGPGVALMKKVLEKLTNDDYVAILAYVSSRVPAGR